jgi:hypothetical protein
MDKIRDATKSDASWLCGSDRSSIVDYVRDQNKLNETTEDVGHMYMDFVQVFFNEFTLAEVK